VTNINLKKKDIVKDLSKKIGFSSNYSKKIIDDLIHIILINIKTGNFNLKDIGTFKIISKKERLGRNPKTKKEYIISKRKSVTFTPSKILLNVVNKI
jgi:integration host factor subunit alpha|tara:strand:- start:413 stop:703 length:291 start_codon:yes stop_codon:yes gene_type:complete